MYAMKEERVIGAKAFAHLASSTLYERRCVAACANLGRPSDSTLPHRFGPYFIEPVIAGLEEDGTPFIAATDLIGCINLAKVRRCAPVISCRKVDRSTGLCRLRHRLRQAFRYGGSSLGARSRARRAVRDHRASTPERAYMARLVCVCHEPPTIAQAIDRDAFSHGGTVWVIESDKVTKRNLKARLD
jgi:20S proteasome subunit beta 3